MSPDVSQFGSGYSGSWVIDPALSNLSTLTEEEATKECSNIGYNSCGYSQYVNEGSRPQMQIEDGRSCEQLTSGEAEGVLTVRGTQALVSFAPLAFKLFCAARQNAVLRRSSFPSP